MRGNLFLNIENPIKYASESERVEIAKLSLAEMINFVNETQLEGSNELLVNVLVISLQLSRLLGNGKTQKKREFLLDVLSIIKAEKFIDIYDNHPADENSLDEIYNIFRVLGQFGPGFVLPFLKLLICFAYADGVLSDKFASDFESIFSENLMVDFFNSGLESVPSPTEQVTVNELQRELITFFQKDDQMLPLDEICKQFPTYTKSQIKSALDEMVEMGIFYGGDSIFMCMYALTPEGLSMRI